ncbi:MAG: GntR family transcriptional regulator [Alloprevotella sp.]|nr:GntR family transcriptional regulator [Alloprevotella sp.]
MLKLGDFNTLRVTRFIDYGAMLEAGDVGEILMPKSYVSPELKVGDDVRVFVYLDQEERLVATTETPLARVGDFAYLRVNWVNRYGAFLHWGLMKDLFCPFREQRKTMEVGKSYIVHIYIDRETGRLVASAKVDKFLQPAEPHLYPRAKAADLLIWQKSPLGFKVIVDNRHSGMLYDRDLLLSLHTGDRIEGSVIQCRPDGKLDVAAGSIGKARFRDFADVLLQELRNAGGTLPFCDKSNAAAIAERFAVSKKTFKRAVGTLYKAQKIELHEGSITLKA